MEDYTSNSKKSKEKAKVPPKEIEKVVVGDVVVQKKSIGRKFKDIFIEADFKTVAGYVASEVFLPAFRNMIVDGASKGVERMMYGEVSRARRPYGSGIGPRVSYTQYSNPMHRPGPGQGPNRRPSEPRGPRHSHDDFIISYKEDADLVIERMHDILDKYEVASVADLKELIGLRPEHTDNKWGWVYLGDAQIRQIREGYLLVLPEPELLN